ncbi:putative mitochondrial hypothetical protein [Leptomonas pyrrhocoris]|uniref:Uncharacterized protein n=1 Tax=Leptomonas pyrrhocoris TaxID=157538 RepID=A0A0M9G2W9_LEPPY|nr:putative mitochondrial hypothetical protein [Leptomonas pyrrhocoris]KPA81127.1 putative mitochondrial hypothetical protein [Leptomonas pyrrhocoris]|eukprot:XP_015659566.1 putative mitochondrial hypothetical protein [Leptomonas pyrrhocoris]
MLRLRSASVFLRYCCFKLQDRRLAFAVYEKALQHKIELTEPDYVALGTVCVQLCEPISTLFFMLEEMKEHVPGVSAAFLADVVEPWVANANSANSRIGGAKTTRVPRYHVATVARMEQQERTALQSTSKALLNSAEVCLKDGGSDKNSSSCAASSQPLIQACGVCPVCHTELSGYAFTAACRNHLLSELKDLVIPQACRSRRALLGFEHWKRYIHARYDSGDRVDVFIDGANLGYYGLSSWYDLAKKQLLLHRGVAEGQITAQDLNFNEQCKASAKGVDVGVNFDLIDSAVKLAVEKYGLRRPLVMLHERHVEPRFMTPQAAVIVQHWRSLGWLYCTPTGLNDDLCWLYGALLMTDPTDRRGEGRQRAATAASTSHRTLVCTNDKMRDHHFRLLSPRAFTRWRDRHRIGFRCGRVENRTELYWDLPAPYARCIQRHDLVLPPPPSSTTSASPEGERVKAENGGAAVSTWHIPFSKDPAVSSAASFLSSMRTAEGTTAESCSELDGAQLESGQQANPSTDGDPIVEQADGDNDELHASTDIQESSPWICVTVEA